MKKLFLVMFFFLSLVVNIWSIGPYVDNGDGTVTDKGTGLMWQKSDDGVRRNWKDALSYCENLTLARYDDWRLPNIREFGSIIDYNSIYPAIDKIFNYTFVNEEFPNYWSSTTVIFKPDEAWAFGFEYGYNQKFLKKNKYFVRCVRGGKQNVFQKQ